MEATSAERRYADASQQLVITVAEAWLALFQITLPGLGSPEVSRRGTSPPARGNPDALAGTSPDVRRLDAGLQLLSAPTRSCMTAAT
jgi:hypothetical protein